MPLPATTIPSLLTKPDFMADPDPRTHSPYEDEIDLFELIAALWRAKWLIGLITVVVTGAAVAYALLATPAYETQAKTLPPTASDLAEYSVAYRLLEPALRALGSDRAGIKERDASEVYAVFLRYLLSSSLRERFFNDVYLPANAEEASDAERESLWREFNQALSVQQAEAKSAGNKDEASVSFQGIDAQALADWTNTFIRMAADAAKQQLLADLKSTVQSYQTGIQDQIDSLRIAARDERHYETARLESALKLAQAIGLEEPPASGNLITSYTGSTLYLQGAQALRAKLDLLQARKSDDPYIDQLPGLQYAQKLLSKVNLAPQDLTVVTVDRPALRPWQPVKPKKRLIVALGLILGLMLGAGTALVRHAWQEHRRSTMARA